MEKHWKIMDEEEFRIYSNNIREKILEDEVYLTLERYARQAPKKELKEKFKDYIKLMANRKMDEKTYDSILRTIEKMDYLTHDVYIVARKPVNIYQTI